MRNRCSASCGVERPGRLVQDQDARAAEQRFQDLDPLLHPDRQIGDLGVEIDLEAVFPLQLRDLVAARAAPAARVRPPSAPSSRFSSTVNGSTSMKCWWTMPIPARIASCGLWIWRSSPVDPDGPPIGLIVAVENVHERRLAGAVLADDAVDRAARDRAGGRSGWRGPGRSACRCRSARPPATLDAPPRSRSAACAGGVRQRYAHAPGAAAATGSSSSR